MQRKSSKRFRISILLCWALCLFWAVSPAGAATQVPVSGEIYAISLNDPADIWSGGTITVGGFDVIIPRNLLIDLPANRLTLQQIFAQAPAACVALSQSGLAKEDTCNTSGTGGFATISANFTSAGDVIAGDVFIEKGRELVTGIVNFIDYTAGFLRVNGTLDDPTTGVMIRLNDPGSRHTVQQGLGCAGGPNCSADPRFTLDPDNYVITFTTGYPACIPSTVSRSFTDLLGSGTTTSQAAADGTGDFLCPDTNRPINNQAADSRRFAPIKTGDSITAEGNFEVINGVQFLSTHTLTVNTALTTGTAPNQPDYIFLAEMEVDAPAFNNERARTLFIGFATLAPSDVLLWSIHYDPADNLPHEFPLASVRGCDTVGGGAGACSRQGIGGGNLGGSGEIFKIRYDVDFVAGIAKPELGPCAVIEADPRFPADTCPDDSLASNLAVLSPIPHEIQARTGRKVANPDLVTVDINGNEATNGQYLFPLGANLGGIGFPEFVEVDLNAVATAFPFTGIPWNLDRRLSPGGCDGPCEQTPQPLDPFPFEGYDPRLQAAIPPGPVGVSFSNNSSLRSTADRILSFVDGNLGKFDGENTVLSWPPADPAPQGAILPLTVTPASISLVSGQTATATLGGGRGTITAASDNTAIASAAVAGRRVNVTGGTTEGTATITVTDSLLPAAPVTISVTVTAQTIVGGAPGAVTLQVGLTEQLSLLLNVAPRAGDIPAQEWFIFATVPTSTGGAASVFLVNSGLQIVSLEAAAINPAGVTFNFNRIANGDTVFVANTTMESFGVASGSSLIYAYAYSTTPVTSFADAPSLVIENVVRINVQ